MIICCVQVGFQATYDKFSVFWAVTLLLGLISETLGVLCSGLFRSQLLGAIVLQGLYVPLLMFVGFFQVSFLLVNALPACPCAHRISGRHSA
jgi:hypothetical protein